MNATKHQTVSAVNTPEQVARSRETFKRLYIESLKEAVAKHPLSYAWPIENVPVVAERMFDALYRGTFNYDSKAFAILAKKLGIKHTRTAILAAWEGRS